MMKLVPVLIDIDKNDPLYADEDCQEIFKSYPDYYYTVGYHPPWIGYFAVRDEVIVGVGGFVEKPKDGRVEIAYGTYKKYEGQGVATFTCKQLIHIAKTVDRNLIVTAKTAPEQNASVTILQRNGFQFKGIVQDHEIGDAWEWVLEEKSASLNTGTLQ